MGVQEQIKKIFNSSDSLVYYHGSEISIRNEKTRKNYLKSELIKTELFILIMPITRNVRRDNKLKSQLYHFSISKLYFTIPTTPILTITFFSCSSSSWAE